MNYRAKQAKLVRKRRLTITIGLAICLVATLGYLRTRLWVVDLSYRYNKLQKQLAQVKEDNSRLRVEMRRLKSPARVDHLARTKLNLRTRDEIKGNVPVVIVSSDLDHPERD